ncbi:glycyl-tRNA synthetase [Nematocida parisii]|uniref:glycyl-tRNA synthetase n=1 Tax=Nematocida parisii (strain ERTm1 / ATCC PRA-289) TaxID=881290 RepID=UPI000264B839|nr:glycyl-tRNA synthetase [Nematocida parisii ERTm1]EIJ95087.1 glycyl-tRNA synthetase [Nematocida parisii ERTm1]KAI5144629.1 glycyl-tRNA synthetase [Nematocida parisii]KAI5153136.1 glycyl-tRNA synthetase [Nematocida parisii]KAI5156393.1 glycyl-tRNA synthetase [Nematocida parisii]|eukprot:XP_013058443.1 glycyl-tRNA synthetase [Nematocida parisii ERTm1]
MNIKVKEKREKLEQVAKRRFFYTQSFESYGGVSGFFDFGPNMCALQNNFLSIWRNHFVLTENMLEVDTAIITPFEVLKSSGHVEKFTDLMCADSVTGEVYRADHLVRDYLLREAENKDEREKQEFISKANMIDSFGKEELQGLIDKYGIKSDNKNALTKIAPFNLMFNTIVGPCGKSQSFLRPETAQGQFLNFKRLLENNGDKMPFASATVGKAFRNEISPRTGLFRVREFLMAEIEHFVHPEEKSHPKFAKYSSIELPLLFREKDAESEDQAIHTMSMDAAVKKGIVNNETLGYFIIRVYQFLVKIGIPESAIRIRQHLPTEMAHYATDCWDVEIDTAFGWIECVGIADRACYDLSVHSKKTGDKLVARRRLTTPTTEKKTVAVVNKKELGSKFRSQAQKAIQALEALTEDEIEQKKISENEIEIELLGEKIVTQIEKLEIVKHIEEYTPSVIEPSFGIGRILYALLWHSFWIREDDEQKSLFSFTPGMAPIKCIILPLQEDERFTEIITSLKDTIVESGISCNLDESKASIGRRYSRADEIGIPFCITVDFDTLEDKMVTLRERDSTLQIRIAISDIPSTLTKLVKEEISFDSLQKEK